MRGLSLSALFVEIAILWFGRLVNRLEDTPVLSRRYADAAHEQPRAEEGVCTSDA